MTKSILTSDIEVSCKDKAQLAGVIAWCIKHNYCFEYDVTFVDTSLVYSIRVPSLSWARNLKGFAEVLMESDLCNE